MEAILLTHSQLAAVVAGFSSVVVAFHRPLSPIQRHRFLTILFSSLLWMIACLVPVWFSTAREVDSTFWSTFSGVHLGLSLLLLVVLVFPLRSLGKPGVIAVNMPITVVVYFLLFATIALLRQVAYK